MTTLTMIAALANNLVIGGNNKLLWTLPKDWSHFKKHTIKKPIIMGRLTFESLPKLLPDRTHIVISSKPTSAQTNTADVVWVNSIDAALETAKNIIKNTANDEIMVIGGGNIYKQMLPLADKMYLTRVHKDVAGDTYFPDWSKGDDKDKWQLIDSESCVDYNKDEEIELDFETWQRTKN